MATLRNATLQKLGNLQTSASGQAVGHTQLQLVVPSNPLPQPAAWGGDSKESISSYQARVQAYLQSVQVTQKFSLDWE